MRLLVAFVGFFLLSEQAFSFVEVKGLGGFNISYPKTLNRYLKDNRISEVYANGISGADAFLMIPMGNKFYFGFGARYDEQNISVKGADGTENHGAEIMLFRYSGMLQMRWTGENWFAGLVGGAGHTHTQNIKIKHDNVLTKYDQAYTESSFGGLTSGVRLGWLVISAEGGFQSYLVREIKNSSVDASFDVNFGGFYGLFAAGFQFF